ncbi:MAG: hypothetical protein IBX72_09980 [Nitrospirae bacterium]|nr:hypothetical protein [Nitrospirota bacterium]
MKDFNSMSKEELESLIQELKTTIKDLEESFHAFKKASEHESGEVIGEVINRFQEELKKIREGIDKLEKIKEKHET